MTMTGTNSGLRIALCVSLAIAAGAAFGCKAVPLAAGAEWVIVSREAQPETCKFLGALVGQQGGAWSGSWTSNRNLAQGALNELRNQARALGANYVKLESEHAGVTGSGSTFEGTGSYSSAQTDVTKTGNAYKCPPEEIGL
jgi:uncharacterized protein YbjQ (UPF0145 family)